ncbi:hypothetical protein, partial [Endozoicomonas sp. ONNA1]
MKKLFNLFPLFLWLLYSTAQASPTSQNDFDFLEPFNDTALVANGLELTGSIAGVSLSTLLNLGVWWGVCKTAGIFSGLSRTYDLAESDTKELEALKTDFCWQLAPVMTTAEVALAGHVSPWPLKQWWWKPQYFIGAGMAGYAAVAKTRELVPVAVLTYFASEAISRTGTGAISALILRKMGARDISTESYAVWQYPMLSLINGVIVGTVGYEAMIYKGHSPVKATLASVFSALIVGTLSGVLSLLTVDAGKGQTPCGVLAAAVGWSGGAAALVPTAVTKGGTGTIAGAVTKAGAIVTAIAGAGAGALAGAGAGAGFVVVTFTGGSAAVLGGVGALLILVSSKKISDNRDVQALLTFAPALVFAVINSLSNYAVYGHPLEEGFSETVWTQWKKFYAPLDYLSTLF